MARHVFSVLLLVLSPISVLARLPIERDPAPPAPADSSGAGLLTRLGSTWFRHGSTAYCVSLSADGKLLASSHGDNIVRLWDPETGQELRRFTGHTGFVRSVALSPDGKLAASVGGNDNTTRIWETATGKELYNLAGHSGNSFAIAFSSDGKTVVSGDGSGLILVWDATTGKQLHRITGHKGTIMGMCFSPDGKEFASCSHDQMVRRWETATGKLIAEFEAYKVHVGAISYSPDGKMFATGSSSGEVSTWNIETGKQIKSFEAGKNWVLSTVFTPDMKSLAVGGQGDIGLKMIDLETGKMRSLEEIEKRVHPMIGIAISADGKTLIAGGEDHQLRVLDPATLKTVARVADVPSGHVTFLAFAPDGKSLAWGSTDADVVRIAECTGMARTATCTSGTLPPASRWMRSTRRPSRRARRHSIAMARICEPGTASSPRSGSAPLERTSSPRP